MENYNLTKCQFGVIIPEYLYMRAENGDIHFIFIKKAWVALSAFFETFQVREDWKLYIPSAVSVWGVDGVMSPVQETEVGFLMKIDIPKQLEHSSRVALCETLSGFSVLLNIFLSESWNEKRPPGENEQTQLFSLELFFDKDRSAHAGGIVFSVSPKATQFLQRHERQPIPNGLKEMKEHHIAKFPDDRNETMLHGLSAVIREKGTLDFKTYGNCACLGTSPDDIRGGNGYAITSHNVDSSWQQLSLVVGIARTWEWVRTEIKYQ